MTDRAEPKLFVVRDKGVFVENERLGAVVVCTLVLSLVDIVESQEGSKCATSNEAVHKLVYEGGFELSCLRYEEVSFVAGLVQFANLVRLLNLFIVLVGRFSSSDMLPRVLVQDSDCCLAEAAL